MVSRNIEVLLSGFLLLLSVPAIAGWEVGAKAGFDTNVNRAVDGEKSDSYLAGYASFLREPDGESRCDWTVSASVESAAFLDVTDLTYGAIAGEPGIVCFPRWWLTVAASPFIKGTVVKDTDQSAFSFGGKVRLRERIRSNLYLGQYYVYTDSRAEEETYSFTEHAAGVYFGVLWRKGMFSEVGYEFSHGDSFRTVSTTASLPAGSGKKRRFSSAFGADVVRETVDRHAISFSAGIDWTPYFTSQAGYTYTANEGDLGSFSSHSGYVGTGYRF
jgi:hypothetical protein